MAIAEWPTNSSVALSGPLDYALFVDTKLIGVIEAKAIHKDIPSVIDYQGPVFLAFLIAGVIGMVLGLLNGVLAAWLKLPTLIITLGTCTIFLGITQGVLQSSVISVLPVPMAKMGTKRAL